jgi:hypothetical protein
MSSFWKISKLDRQSSDDLVIKAHFTVSSSLDEFAICVYGFVILERGSSFIPYDQLSENEVIGWVKNALGETGVNLKEQELSQKIANAKTPSVLSGTPW